MLSIFCSLLNLSHPQVAHSCVLRFDAAATSMAELRRLMTKRKVKDDGKERKSVCIWPLVDRVLPLSLESSSVFVSRRSEGSADGG